MAVSSHSFSRPRDYSRLFIALAVLAGVVAIAPIAAAVLGLGKPATGSRTAFASAPAGEYAVIGRNEGNNDVIAVAWAENPRAITEIARLPHLEGFTSTGAVSPAGNQLALVTVDGGSRTQPLATLNVVNLETGRVIRAVEDILPAQVPVWSEDGKRLIVVRIPGGAASTGKIDVLSVASEGGDERVIDTYNNAFGVYPVGWSNGRLATVVIDGSGSRLRGLGNDVSLSPNITRDWKLSPNGAELSYIEADSSNGVRYFARSISLDGTAHRDALAVPVTALGVAYAPGGGPTFGVEPGQAATAGVAAQALTTGEAVEGFDVPMAYSPSGDALVVTHYSGGSFANPGQPALQVLAAGQRTAYEAYTRFYGWSGR